MSRFDRLDAALAVAFVAGLSALAVSEQKPPPVVPASAPATEFSAERGMRHVRAIAARPHPTGSEESAKVRALLDREMRALGMEPEVLAHPSFPGESLLGRIPGTVRGKAVMLVAHYDSREEAPGAGDDAAGVAAVLEAVRALRAGPPLKNDLWVLLTDGEERGLLGALAFVYDSRRRDSVGVILNFEARGTRGPSYMFETSDRNGWLLREFARAAPHPIATSLTGDVYRKMPNSTDLTVFKSMNLKGLNFAFVDGYEHYHRPTDTPENLDPRSLQHHGSYALALARHFGGLDLSRADSEADAVYFHAFGPHLIVYPGWLVTPLMMAAGIGYGGLALVGLRLGRLTGKGLIAGIALAGTAILVALAVALLPWLAIRPGRPVTPKGQGSPEIAVALTGVALVAALALLALRGRKSSVANLAAGGLFWWLALTVASSVGLPGGSYLFLWPTLFGLIALAAAIFARPGSLAERGSAYLAALPALALLPPTLQSLCAALGPNLPFAPAPVAGLFAVALVPMLAKFTRVRPAS